MKAVLVDPNAPGHLALGDVEPPQPAPSEALVRVKAISLNRGEVRAASHAPAGARLGWDLAGTVEQPAADGSGPKAGARVVGFVLGGAWAELVPVPVNSLAELPDAVSFAQASTLPIAGLTALYGLEKAGGLIGKAVLITGATGGVGHFAVQLARIAGARVVAQVRRPDQVDLVRAAGAHEVAVTEDGAAAGSFGPYDLILDGVGGPLLGNIMAMLARGGTCVAYGATGGGQLTFELPHFYRTGGATLYGFIIFHEVKTMPASGGLRRLAELVAAGTLRPLIEVEAGWDQFGAVAQRLLDRGFAGKAVLHVGR
jgi:NADPH:quinone reductase-like Zn-dependent oxidoreductase